MLDSTLDLISQAVSSNVYAFCLFNLIFVMILMRSKHGSSFDQDYEIPLSTPTPTPTCTYYHKQLVKEGANKHLVDKGEEEMINGSIVPSASEADSEENKDDCNGNNSEANDEEEEEEEGDNDELRRRVEEFIAKVNREWRAEKFGMSISALDLRDRDRDRDRQGC